MRRLISLVSAIVALVGLGFVLVNATTVDRRPPSVKTIALSASAGDPRLAQTVTAIDIEFSEPVKPATAEARFRIDPVVDGSFTWNGSSAIFTPSRKLPQDTTFTISIAPGTEDLEGNRDPTGLEEWTFATVGPPVVLRTTPADGAGGVPLDGTIDLFFDRLMDTASVEGAISIEPAVPVSSSWRGSVVSITLGPGLTAGTRYTLTIGAQATDTGGSRLGSPFRTTFMTVGAGLAIVTAIPADGVAGIGIGSPIAVRFDGPIDPVSIPGALHLTPSVDGTFRVVALDGDGSGRGAGAPSTDGNTLVFVPSTPLASHTTYTVTLDPIVSRLGDPAAVTLGRTWSFTTGAPTESGQNQIGFLSARGGVRNVWVMNPDGTNQRQLTTELLPVTSFDTTADGARVVYAAGGVVQTMAIDGTGLRRLTVSDGRLEYAPSLLPDGSAIIVARRDPVGADLGYWFVPLPGSPGDERPLLGHGAPGPDSTTLSGDGLDGTDGSPAWIPRTAFDPSGRTALLVTATGEVQLIDLGAPDLSGSPSPPLRLALSASAAATWVSARNTFVLAGAPASGGATGMVSIDTLGGTVPISGTTGAVGPIAVLPNGSLGFVIRQEDGQLRLRLLSASGDIRDLDPLPGRMDRWPGSAPDGLSLLIGRVLAVDPTISDGIWRIDLPTGTSRRLTVDGAYAGWIR
ncbi:MAG: Ig-like domain-containing protein [Chloroflexota bacterium]